MKKLGRAALGAALAAIVVTPAAAQKPAAVPEGVTQARVAEGAKLYKGTGLCAACHGPEGKGGVGPDLTDTLWLHSAGAFDDIVRQITEGVPQAKAKTGIMMPPRGGSGLSDEQVRAVAAYVWRLSHPAR